MTRQHRRRATRVFYYSVVFKLMRKSFAGYRPLDDVASSDELDWYAIHYLPSRTLARCLRTAERLRKRFHWPNHQIEAPAVLIKDLR